MKKILLIGLLAFSSLSANYEKMVCDVIKNKLHELEKENYLQMKYGYFSKVRGTLEIRKELFIEFVSKDCLKLYYKNPKEMEKIEFEHFETQFKNLSKLILD